MITPEYMALVRILDRTVDMINSSKAMLNHIEYVKDYPIESKDLILATSMRTSQEQELINIETECNDLESENSTDDELKQLSIIRDNIAIIKEIINEILTIIIGEDNGVTSMMQGPVKLMLDVFSGKIVLPKGSQQEELFMKMMNAFFDDELEDDFHPVKNDKEPAKEESEENTERAQEH